MNVTGTGLGPLHKTPNVPDKGDNPVTGASNKLEATSEPITPVSSTAPKSLVYRVETELLLFQDTYDEFDQFQRRLNAEHHDSMKPIPWIMDLLNELHEKLESCPEIQEQPLDKSYIPTTDEVLACAIASKEFCETTDDYKDEIIQTTKRPYDALEQLLVIHNYSVKKPLDRIMKRLVNTTTRLAQINNPSDDLTKCLNLCNQIQNQIALVSRFVNMVQKFYIGYKGIPQKTDINNSIQEALYYFHTDKVAHYLDLDSLEEFEKNKKPLPTINIDPDLLCKVWLNLATNSAEACMESNLKGVPFTIKTSLCPDGNFIEVKAIDKGPGIDPAKVSYPNKILERGFSTKSGKENQGLGMDIIKQIIEEAGGSINVDSEFDTDNSGTTITIKLPVVK